MKELLITGLLITLGVSYGAYNYGHSSAMDSTAYMFKYTDLKDRVHAKNIDTTIKTFGVTREKAEELLGKKHQAE